MFLNNNNFKEIGKDIYVYNNYLSESELFFYQKAIGNMDPYFDWEQNIDHANKWFNNRLSLENENFIPLLDKIKKTFEPTYIIQKRLGINRLQTGDEWGLHADDYEFREIKKQSLSLKKDEPYEMFLFHTYGLVIYFNKFEGGELYYPNQGIKYKPFPGDLVLHSSSEHCAHGVTRVISGPRYSYSSGLSEYIKIPKR